MCPPAGGKRLKSAAAGRSAVDCGEGRDENEGRELRGGENSERGGEGRRGAARRVVGCGVRRI